VIISGKADCSIPCHEATPSLGLAISSLPKLAVLSPSDATAPRRSAAWATQLRLQVTLSPTFLPSSLPPAPSSSTHFAHCDALKTAKSLCSSHKRKINSITILHPKFSDSIEDAVCQSHFHCSSRGRLAAEAASPEAAPLLWHMAGEPARTELLGPKRLRAAYSISCECFRSSINSRFGA